MRSKMTVLLAAIIVNSTLVAPALADDKGDIYGAYKKLESAFKARSVDAVMALCTDDFTMVTPGQVLATEEVKKTLKQSFSMMKKSPDFRMTVDKLALKAKSAEAKTIGVMKVDIVDPEGVYGSKGAKHATNYTIVSRDSWVKTAKGWRMKETETVSEKMLIDGKPYSPGGGGAKN